MADFPPFPGGRRSILNAVPIIYRPAEAGFPRGARVRSGSLTGGSGGLNAVTDYGIGGDHVGADAERQTNARLRGDFDHLRGLP
jgi:hypothetical protein